MGNYPDTCERCESWNGLDVAHFDRFEIPDKWDRLCRDCAEEVNTHTAEEMSDAALIASIMEDSIGYASPHHAEQHVEAFRDGERFAYCERAVSCFPMDPDDVDEEDRMILTGKVPGDLDKLIEQARAKWCAMSDDRREELHEFAMKWREAEDPGTISSIGLMYPTNGP